MKKIKQHCICQKDYILKNLERLLYFISGKQDYAFWSLVSKFYLQQLVLLVKKNGMGKMGEKRKKQT